VLSGPARVWRVPGIVSTDDILPAVHKHRSADPAELARHVFEHAVPGLADRIGPGDALVGGDIFGIGSSREQAVDAMLAAGVGVVLAPAFGRIFFRNAWNLGLVALQVPDPPWRDGDNLEVDLERGVVRGETGVRECAPVPPQMLAMLRDGGLLAHVRRQVSGHG
jgi:3-isopropylmalate/(R)-2-methylmalate dehydratase small subunit